MSKRGQVTRPRRGQRDTGENALDVTDAIGASESGNNGMVVVGKGNTAMKGGPTVTAMPDSVVIDENFDLVEPGPGDRPAQPGDGLVDLVGAAVDEAFQRITSFISMDPPKHTEQRKTVRGVSAPSNLRNLEPLIRERTCQLLDSLPDGETFDWVDTVSIELTTAMLATLFDFPYEDRRKLTFWSDMATIGDDQLIEAGQAPEDREIALRECLDEFTKLWNERDGEQNAVKGIGFGCALAFEVDLEAAFQGLDIGDPGVKPDVFVTFLDTFHQWSNQVGIAAGYQAG